LGSIISLYGAKILRWFIGVILPLVVTGQFPDYALMMVTIFATYIIGDLIAIPFSYIFAKKLEPVPTSG